MKCSSCIASVCYTDCELTTLIGYDKLCVGLWQHKLVRAQSANDQMKSSETILQ